MKKVLGKVIRTFQVNLPFLLEQKFLFQRTYRNGLKIPAEAELNALKFFPKDQNALYLDIGGNRGQSLDAILMRSSSNNIQSFEPNPIIYQKLAKTFANNPRVTIHNIGFGDRAGKFTLYIPAYNGFVFDGLASLEYESAASWLGEDTIYFFDKKHLAIEEVECVIKRVDDLELEPFFIKLMILGYELPILKGAEQTLSKSKPIILILWTTKAGEFEEAMNYLGQLGYKLYAYKDEEKQFVLGEGSRLSFLMTDDKLEIIKQNINASK